MKKSHKLRWGMKLLFAFCSAVILFGTVYASGVLQNGEVSATSVPSSSFAPGDKVFIANDSYTVIDNISGLKLLKDATSYANNVNWTTANSYASSYPTSSTVGINGVNILKNKFSLPNEADLSKVRNGSALYSYIPSLNGDWWLGDASVNNRSKFLTSANSFNGTTSINTVTAMIDTTSYLKKCIPGSKNEVGVKVTNTKKDNDASINLITSKEVYLTVKKISGSGNGKAYSGFNCSGNIFLPSFSMDVTTTPGERPLLWENGVFSLPIQGAGGPAIRAIAYNNSSFLPTFMKWKAGSSQQISFLGGTCVNLSPPEPDKLPKYNSIMLDDTTVMEIEVYGNPKESKQTQYCAGASNNAGVALVRPKLTLSDQDILFANTNQRTYPTPGNTLSSPFPSSDTGSNKPYLTLYDPSLKVSLDKSANAGINGNTMTVVHPQNNILDIPITVSGNAESTRYVSAKALVDDGSGNLVERYGILKQVTSNTDVVSLDLTQFANDPTTLKTLNLTLYQENKGINMSAYMGDGLDVTINFLSQQDIAFDDNTATTAQYGQTIQIGAHLNSDIGSQSADPIKFSIKSGKATITQTANWAQGTASASIVPTSGTGTIVIAIQKAGDTNAAPAQEVTHTITLSPKLIIVHPQLISKIYGIGEAMPTIGSASDDLEPGDSIPAALKPTLQPLQGAATRPDTSGTITNAGTWKLIYPANALDGLTDFTDKYAVTLEDWNQNNAYIFQTAMSDIPANWIDISPVANANGWNSTSVTLTPSADAIAQGFSVIEVLNSVDSVIKSGSNIVYSTEINGETPRVRLKKGTYATNILTLRTIRIDLTKPNASAFVHSASSWASSKQVDITASDILSGIESITVTRDDGTSYTPVLQNGLYSFVADENGIYTITISDYAGNQSILTETISMIDTSSISIKAQAQPLAQPALQQSITLTYDAGNSGVQSLRIYHKLNASDTYQLLQTLTPTGSPMNYDAQMNGWFEFELINQLGDRVSDEVEITQINPPSPVTRIDAVYADDSTTTYTSDTWTNHDILLTLTNANAQVSDPITWKYQEGQGSTWKNMTGTTMKVDTGTTIEKTLFFQAVTTLVSETTPAQMIVKIDKTKPVVPVVANADQFTQKNWYADDVDVQVSVPPKANGNPQTIYSCEGTQSVCSSTPGAWIQSSGTLTFTGNGSHELYFIAVDEAGNYSDLSDPCYVNIDQSIPSIDIRIENNSVKTLLNQVTLGFFFNKSVDIDIVVNFGSTQSGTVWYLIEPDDSKPAPDNNDPRWVIGNSTSIDPDAKGRVYVKATSDAGIMARDDSVLQVFADATPPSIQLPADMSSWSCTTSLSFSITDAISGVDPASLTYQDGTQPASVLPYNKPTARISNLSDGAYPLTVSATDYSGNSIQETMQVMIDTVAPVVSTPLADVSGYAKQKTIQLTAQDALSGMKEVEVRDRSGSSITVSDDHKGTYSFIITENDTYTITASDLAGNSTTTSYIEQLIDAQGPEITDIVVDHANDSRPRKDVTFHVKDDESGIQSVVVTYVKNGTTITVPITPPSTGDVYTFTANENADYTITASDMAGNVTSESITVTDIDTSTLQIQLLTDTNQWVKDQMQVSFQLSNDIALSADSPTVTFAGASIPVQEHNGIYTFVATANGDYTIQASNTASQNASETVHIQRIDAYAPVMEDVSDHTTSSAYRKPQTISFHVYDFNDAGRSTMGSGLPSDDPKISIQVDGVRKQIAVTQDPKDASLYSFLAEYNGTYVVEFEDVVGHDRVSESILVDHILHPDLLSPMQVQAYVDTTRIPSGTWVNQTIRFELQGGVDASILEKYQVAVTKGEQPEDADFQDVNKGIDMHEVQGNHQGDVYWFRALPFVDAESISDPFVVNLDSVPPEQVQITMKPIHTGFLAKLVHTLSFGAWMSEAQEITFQTSDNFTAVKDLTYLYKEVQTDENGNILQTSTWKQAKGPLTYSDTNMTLYVKAVDLAGNESKEAKQEVCIDTMPPIISGVKDQSEYKYYYLPRVISVTDPKDGYASGIAVSTYVKDEGTAVSFDRSISLHQTGTYHIRAKDRAGNEAVMTFKIVPLPSLDEIDGSDESKAIIDQIKKELQEVKDQIDKDEAANYEEWIRDAEEKWWKERTSVIVDDTTSSKVEGQGNITFDPNVELIVEEKNIKDFPQLPRKAIQVYDVYLKKGNTIVQPDGTIKVYLPYHESAKPIVYEIDEDGSVKEIACQTEDGYVTFTTTELKIYAISSVDQEETKDPSVNIDIDSNGTPDINIDQDGDGIPEINIDTDGDGVPDYNIDTDGDGKPDLNIGPVPDPWKPELCQELKGVSYCTMKDLRPNLNIDTNNDGYADLNIDLDGDGSADLNIDTDFDNIPNIDIDTTGDGKPDLNVDRTGNGKPDEHVVEVSEWNPVDLVQMQGMTYGTMKSLHVSDPPIKDPEEEPKGTTSVKGTLHTKEQAGVGGAYTGDQHSDIRYLFLMLSAGGSTLLLYVRRKHARS